MTSPDGYIIKKLLSNSNTMQTQLAVAPNMQAVVLYVWNNDSLQALVEPLELEAVENKAENWISFPLRSHERSLFELLENHLVSIEQAFELSIELCRKLLLIHNSGKFVGTLCPENIVWDESNKSVRFLWRANSLWHSQCVNWFYCAPEQTGRINSVPDYRTDFYALGLLFHALFLQHHPFAEVKPKILLRVHISRQVKLPVSSPILAIINTLLEKQANNRYQSASALYADLQQAYLWYKNKSADTGFRPMRKLSDQPNLLSYSNCFVREKYALVDSLKVLATERIALVTLEASITDGRAAFLRDTFSLLSRQSICYLQVFPSPESSEVAYYVAGLLLKEIIHFYRNGDAYLLAKCRHYALSLPETAQQILLCLCSDFALWGVNRQIVPGSQINDYAMLYTVMRDFIRFSNTLTRPLVIFIESPQWVDTASLRLFVEMQDDIQVNNLIFLRFVDEDDRSHFLSGKRLVSSTFHLPRFTEKQLADIFTLNYNLPSQDALHFASLCISKTQGSFDSVNEFLHIAFKNKIVYFNSEICAWHFKNSSLDSLPVISNLKQWQQVVYDKVTSEVINLLQWAAVSGMYFDIVVLQHILAVGNSVLQTWLDAAVAAYIIEYLPHYQDLNSNKNRALYRFSSHAMRQCFLPVDAVDFKRRSVIVLHQYVDLLHHHDGFLWSGLLLENKTLWAECEVEKQYSILQFIHGLAKRLMFFTRLKDAERLNAYCFSLLKPIAWLDRYYLSKEVYHLALSLACSTSSFERIDSLYAAINQALTDEDEKYSFHLIKMANAIEREQFESARSIANLLLIHHKIESPNNSGLWGKIVLGFKEKLFENKLFNDEIAISSTDETISDRVLAEINLLSCKQLPDVYQSSIEDIIKRVANQGIKDCFAMPLLFYAQQLITTGADIEKGIKLAQIIHQYIFSNPELQRQKTLFFIIYILPFVKKITTSMKTLKASIHEALVAGDHKSAHFLATHFIIHQFLSGCNISTILREIQAVKQLMPLVSKSLDFYNFITIAENRTRSIADIHYQFDESDVATNSGNHISYWNDLALLLFFYYKADYEKALISAENAQRKSGEIETQTNTYLLDFYHALTMLELYGTFGEKRQNEILDHVGKVLIRFKNYAHSCPENFEHKYLLLSGVWHQTKGETSEAIVSLKKSIAQSELYYFRNICGLARYRLAKLQLEQGDSQKARRNILQAYNNFILFGAQTIAQTIKFEHFAMFEDIEMNIYNIE